MILHCEKKIIAKQCALYADFVNILSGKDTTNEIKRVVIDHWCL